MEELVAVAVRLDNGDEQYFVTWRRIQDAVDPRPVEDLVLRYASVCGLGGTAVSARLCATLQEAATEPYFYEALFDFSRRTRPTRRYKRWRAARDRAMEAGREIYFLGRRR